MYIYIYIYTQPLGFLSREHLSGGIRSYVYGVSCPANRGEEVTGISACLFYTFPLNCCKVASLLILITHYHNNDMYVYIYIYIYIFILVY